MPEELLEAARIDGAGPFKFLIDILIPLSRTMIAAVFIIMFVYGWNQYLWPMLMTTDESFYTLMRGIKQILQVWVGAQIPDYNEAFAMAVLAILPLSSSWWYSRAGSSRASPKPTSKGQSNGFHRYQSGLENL